MTLKIRILSVLLSTTFCSLPLFAQAQTIQAQTVQAQTAQAQVANSTATEIQSKAAASSQAGLAQTVVSNSEQNQASSEALEKAEQARKENFRAKFREQWRQIESSSNSDVSVTSVSDTCVYSRSSFTYSCN